MSISSVAVVGAAGNLGVPLAHALLEGQFKVTALRRAGSKSVVPGEGRINVVDVDIWTVAALTPLLRGYDAVVVCFPLNDGQVHLNLAAAAAAAGVRRYIPADFGSTSVDAGLGALPLYDRKAKVEASLKQLVAAQPSFSWTSVVGGHFFDWGLETGFLHYDLDKRAAVFLDDGMTRFSTSTLGQVSKAVVSVLKRGADDKATANQVVYIQSFSVTQQDVFVALERATEALPIDRGLPWAKTGIPSEEFMDKYRAKAAEDDDTAMLEVAFALGIVYSNFDTQSRKAMPLLGLEEENLDEVITRIVQAHAKAAKKQPQITTA